MTNIKLYNFWITIDSNTNTTEEFQLLAYNEKEAIDKAIIFTFERNDVDIIYFLKDEYEKDDIITFKKYISKYNKCKRDKNWECYRINKLEYDIHGYNIELSNVYENTIAICIKNIINKENDVLIEYYQKVLKEAVGYLQTNIKDKKLFSAIIQKNLLEII